MARNIADTINPKTRLAVSIILLLSTFISLMSQTMMITALPVIQNQMNQSLTTVQWLTTGYTLLIGIVTPLSSNISLPSVITPSISETNNLIFFNLLILKRYEK